MSEPAEPSRSKTESSPPFQFGLSTLLATALMLAILFGYLRPFGTRAVVVCGLAVVAAVLIGGVVGTLARRSADAILWAVVGAVFAYLAVVGSVLYDWSAEYAWPAVGMVAGATVGAFGPGRPLRRMALASLAAAAVYAAYALARFGFNPDLVFDLLSAILGGALMGLVAEVAERFERRTSVPRYAMAIGFAIAAILGHALVLTFVPGI